MDIDMILRNMRANTNRKYWSCCVLLEEEEQNKNIDIFSMCLKDKRKDLVLINKLKEEVKLLKSMNVDLYKKMDIMEHNEKEHENIDKMLDVVINKMMSDELSEEQYKKLMTIIIIQYLIFVILLYWEYLYLVVLDILYCIH